MCAAPPGRPAAAPPGRLGRRAVAAEQPVRPLRGYRDGGQRTAYGAFRRDGARILRDRPMSGGAPPEHVAGIGPAVAVNTPTGARPPADHNISSQPPRSIRSVRRMPAATTRPPTRCSTSCLLYTSDAADEEDSVDL